MQLHNKSTFLEALLYPVKPHLIRVSSSKMNSFLGIKEHHKVQCFNPIGIMTLQGNNNINNDRKNNNNNNNNNNSNNYNNNE